MPVQILYTRVSTEEQAENGLSLEAQRTRLELEAERRGWPEPLVIEDPGRSGKTLNRPGMNRALEMIAKGEADTIAAVKLDRLSRDLEDWITLLKRANRGGWSLVALDLGMDTTTPIGKACAHIMGVFAQLVRELIAANTKEGLAVARRKGKRLGRPSRLPEAVRARILEEREKGRSYAAIAKTLNEQGTHAHRPGRGRVGSQRRPGRAPLDPAPAHRRGGEMSKKRKKGKASKLAGLGSLLPRFRSGSIRANTQTPSKGTTSGGLPSLGKRGKR